MLYFIVFTCVVSVWSMLTVLSGERLRRVEELKREMARPAPRPPAGNSLAATMPKPAPSDKPTAPMPPQAAPPAGKTAKSAH